MNQGTLIVIDGGANVGKATQADMLVERLTSEGFLVAKMDFPRYEQNVVGKVIEDCLATAGSAVMDNPQAAAVLYAADRFESKKQIEAWMAEGRVIVFDRYVTSNMLHQGAKTDPEKREAFYQWIEHLEYDIFGMPRADMTVYLEVPANQSQQLLQFVEGLGVAIVGEEQKTELHQAKVTDCAQQLAETQAGWHTVTCFDENGLRSREAMHDDVYGLVTTFLAQKGVTAGSV
jgi:dTMP kinase